MNPVLIISDTHYHNFHQYAQLNAEGINTRLEDIIRATVEAAKALRAAGGKTIIHCGDVFHVRGNIPPTVLNPVMDMYRMLVDDGFEIHMISGNHDLESNDADRITSTVTALADVGVQVYNEPTRVLIEGEHWTFFPWMHLLADLRSFITKVMPPATTHNLVIHAPMDGVIEGLPDHGLTPKDFDHTVWKNVFCGHYHNHRAFDIHNGKAYSVGALTHQNWGDAASKAGYVLYYPGTKRIQHHETSAPKYIKVEFDDLDVADDIADNYVKVIGGSFDNLADIERVRNELILMGAKAVVVDGMVKRPATTRGGTTSSTAPTLHSILGEYIDRNYPGDDDVKLTALEILGEIYD